MLRPDWAFKFAVKNLVEEGATLKKANEDSGMFPTYTREYIERYFTAAKEIDLWLKQLRVTETEDKVYIDGEEKPLYQALELLTDEMIENGEYSDQTVIDMKNILIKLVGSPIKELA